MEDDSDNVRPKSQTGKSATPVPARSWPQPMGKPVGTAEQSSHKRKRVAMACDRCRAKKSRCDGAQPICSMCRAGEYECVYRMPMPQRDPSIIDSPSLATTDHLDIHRRFQDMENRLRQFESVLSQVGVGSDMPPVTRERSTADDSYSVDLEEHGVQAAMSHNQVLNSHETYEAEPADLTNPMGALAFADEQVSGFFGPSSNIALIRQISSAIAITRDPSFSTSRVSSEIDNAIMSTSRPHSDSLASWVKEAGLKIYALPPESQVLELAHDYFNNTGMLFPHIHADTFFQTYEQMKAENFKNVRISWLALFNMILANAMCSRTDDRLSFADRVSASEVFYQRAAGLTNQCTMQASVEMVQSLLLMAQYLQGSQRTVQTYDIHGQAVKKCFQIGLQSEEVAKRFSPLERETRKRVFYVCVLIDRTLSVTFGRPSSIPDSYVKMDIPRPIPEWTVQPHSIVASTHGLAFFNATIKLYSILWAILETCYGQNIGEDSAPDVQTEIMRNIATFEQQLDEWLDNLPDQLKPWTGDWRAFKPDLSGSTTARLQTILTNRYLNVRCLLHRPVLKILLGNLLPAQKHVQRHSAFSQRLQWQSVEIALEASFGVITIVKSLGGRKKFLGAFWFTLYYLQNAALVVIAVGMVCTNETPVDHGKLDILTRVQQAMNSAITALPTIDAGNGAVEKCRRYLELLRTLIAPLDVGTTQTSSSGSPSRSIQSHGGGVSQNGVPAHMPESQDWVLDDLDMGPFLMDSNFDWLEDIPGFSAPGIFVP